MQRKLLCFLAAGGLLIAADETGIRPRPAPADYPALAASGGATVAAAVVPKDQVGKLFAADLNRDGYLVMEVAVFPGSGSDVQLAARDFVITTEDGTAMRPVAPDVIGARFDRKHKPPEPHAPGNVHVYNTATIGYETGGGPYNNGGRRPGGVYTETGVGVGVGDPGPAAAPPSNDPDGFEIQRELEGKSLPEGRMDHTVAGYLYFPKPSGKIGKQGYKLTWYGPDGQARLTVPLPRK